jgi:hypothetical protein
LIRDALGLTNAVGVDQTLTADETTDCLRALNDLIEDWSTQSLAIFGLGTQAFNTVVAQATYTVGVGGNWNTNRPVRINGDAYSTISGATFPCASITQAEYDEIPVKAQTQSYPDAYLYVTEYPMGLVTLWPVPSAVTPVTFSMDMLIDSVPTAATVLNFPPGYLKGFKYALAVELAPMFGKRLSDYPGVVAIAERTLGNIKRANMSQKKRIMRSAPEYSDSGGGPVSWERGF